MKILLSWRKVDNVAGGVERFLSRLMNEMAARGHEIVLLTWDRVGATSYYPLDQRIRWHQMDIGRPEEKGNWKTRFARMKYVRSVIRAESPDVMLCFESGIFVSLRLFLTGFDIPMISAERNAPTRHGFSDKGYKKYVSFFSLILADKITIQFDRYCYGYPFYLRKKMTAIPNPVEEAKIFAKPEGQPGQEKTLLCVSRISAHQKNPEVLVRAFAGIAARFPEWKLVIAGGGDDWEFKNIRSLIGSLGMDDKISLPGPIKDIEGLCASSHLFCLPSRYEGFPNALAEALAHGLPAVGFEGCAGVSDLIVNDVSGLLAGGNGDVATLSTCLAALMGDDQRRAQMGESAHKSMDAYKPDIVFDLWEKFLIEAAG